MEKFLNTYYAILTNDFEYIELEAVNEFDACNQLLFTIKFKQIFKQKPEGYMKTTQWEVVCREFREQGFERDESLTITQMLAKIGEKQKQSDRPPQNDLFTEQKLKQALDEIEKFEGAKMELINIWNKHKDLQNNKIFLQAMKLKKELCNG